MLKKVKILILVLFVLILSTTINNSYAYNLQYEARILDYNIKNDGTFSRFLAFRTFVKKYYEDSKCTTWITPFTFKDRFADNSYMNKLRKSDYYKNSYNELRLIFHTKPGTIYEGDDGEGIRYATYDGKIPIWYDLPDENETNKNVTSENIKKYIDFGKVGYQGTSFGGYDSGYGTANNGKWKFGDYILLDSEHPYTIAERTFHGPNENTNSPANEKSDSRIALVDYGITGDEYDDLLENIKEKRVGIPDENGYVKIYVTNTLHTKSIASNTAIANYGAVTTAVKNSDILEYPTAYSFIRAIKEVGGWSPKNWGSTDSEVKNETEAAYYSAINEYDNILYVPYDEKVRTVRVSHQTVDGYNAGNPEYLLDVKNDKQNLLMRDSEGNLIETNLSTYNIVKNNMQKYNNVYYQEEYVTTDAFRVTAARGLANNTSKVDITGITKDGTSVDTSKRGKYKVVGYKVFKEDEDGNETLVKEHFEEEKTNYSLVKINVSEDVKGYDFNVIFLYEKVPDENEIYIDFYDSQTFEPLSDNLITQALQKLKINKTIDRANSNNYACKITYQNGGQYNIDYSSLVGWNGYNSYRKGEGETFWEANEEIQEAEYKGPQSPYQIQNSNNVTTLIFYFDTGGGGNTNPRKLYISHVKTSNSNLSIDELNQKYKINELAGKEIIENANQVKSIINTKGFQREYSFSTSVNQLTVKAPSAENLVVGDKTYECIGAKAIKGASYEKIKNNYTLYGINPSIKYNISKNLSPDYSVIIFYYKEVGGDLEDTNFKVSGNLDFIETSSDFKESTYGRNSSDRTSPTNELDYIPASEQLSPYIYGAQPYFIKAIKYEIATENVSSDGVTVSVTRNWTEDPTYNEETGAMINSGGDRTATDSATFSVNGTITYYKIKDLLLYNISEVKVHDLEENEGGKLFNSSDNLSIKTNSAYSNRFTGLKKPDNFKVEITFDSGQSVESSESLSVSEIAETANVKYEITGDNDKYILDGVNIVSDDGVKFESGDISNTSTTVSLDCTKDSSGNTVNYLENIDDYMLGNKNKTTYEDFDYSGNLQTVPENRENGIRELKGDITYTLDSDISVSENNSFVPNKYISTSEGNENAVVSYLSVGEDEARYKQIRKNNISDEVNAKYENTSTNKSKVRRVNVLTPLQLANSKEMFETTDSALVNHSNNTDILILQTGAEFTIKPHLARYENNTVGYSLTASKIENYVKGYFITLSFKSEYSGDNNVVQIYKDGNWRYLVKGEEVPENTDLYIEHGRTYKGISKQVEGSSAVIEQHNKVKILAVTKSIKDMELFNVFKSTNDNRENKGNLFKFSKYQDSTGRTIYVSKEKISDQVADELLKHDDLYGSANHAVYREIITNNIPRIFGFVVTDCTDLAYEKVFRKENSGSTVNEASGTQYYSGKKYWAYNLGVNTMLEDTKRTTLLPLGPYKNTDSTYIFAPKLGYRISFKLKTSGYISEDDTNRIIRITPSYYFIHKDGTGFDKYYNNIDLYYKNSSGKYVKFNSYNIYYKPNDGYRYLSDLKAIDTYGNGDIDTTDTLSTQLVSLNIAQAFILNKNMRATGNSNFIQGWYGEFKLPNSTIAVEKNGDINNPLTDGYIGVKFKLECIDGEIIVSYDNPDRNKTDQTNTSQWDYEGYMGFNSPGSEAHLSLQLEKDDWDIDNETYQKMKGTVLLYDADSRAANDFN